MINCCNELNAGYAADGYARAKGIGVLVVTYGVGALSAINAVAGAYAENLPLVVISGNPPTQFLAANRLIHHALGPSGPGMSFEHDCFKHVTCMQAQIIHLETAYNEINKALTAALTHHKPVYISIASNIAATHHPSFFREPVPFMVSLPSSSKPMLEAAIKHASNFFEGTVKPVIVVGARVRSPRARAAVIKLVEATGMPVAVMPNAKGNFPENHPNFIGVFWVNISTPFCGETITIADRYIFVGPMFNDVSTVGFTHPILRDRLLEVAYTHVSVGSEGFYGNVLMEDFLEAAISAIPPNSKALHNYQAMVVAPGKPLRSAPGTPIRTNITYKHIEDMLQQHYALLSDAGDCWFNATYLKLPEGVPYESQMQYASIGWSVGAALGLAAAYGKKRRVVAFIGDGAFQMTAQEVSTMVRYGFNPLLFIMNNGGYTVEVEIHDGPYNVINNWDYRKLMHAFDPEGARSWSAQVRTEEELEAAIKEATGPMSERTCMIEVILDKDDCSRSLLEFGTRLAFQSANAAQIAC